MRNTPYLSFILLIACTLFACKKSDTISIKATNTSLISGKWLVYQQNTKVYDLNTNALLKDTTLSYTAKSVSQPWYETYNTDGSAYVTSKPYKKAGSSVMSADTTAYLHYSILGSNLTLKPYGGGIETDPIVTISQTDLNLQKTYNSLPPAGWGLDMATNYLFVVQNYYTKQ